MRTISIGRSLLENLAGGPTFPKFNKEIKPTDRVLDFGCGGGYLLKQIPCAERIGVEINPDAIKVARDNGIHVVSDTNAIPRETVDIVISNHALEHTQNPLVELQQLHRILVPKGKIVIVVPCENISNRYEAGNINYHLYSWSPMTLGNLLNEAGFTVVESEAYIHKWPPGHRTIARLGGRRIFDLSCRIYGRLARRWFQVRAVAVKQNDGQQTS